uniref:Methyltransferase type 11 domain-containing protein n=1 Tax=Pyramimonas obovata TaxID=1411642 RepID=A0A7S0WJH7_9CHLO
MVVLGMATRVAAQPQRALLDRRANAGGRSRVGARTVCNAQRVEEKDRMESSVRWAGETDVLSKIVNAAISNAVLYEGIMKPMARRTLIKTAEKNGVQWRDDASKLEATEEVYSLYNKLRDPTVKYPDYYLQPFHAYTEGNLCWQAAFEAESATYSMALRVWPDEGMKWEGAQDRLRASYVGCITAHIKDHNLPSPKRIVDAGCSVGISTRAVHAAFPEAEMTGLDLSPNMLAVATYRDADEASCPQKMPGDHASLRQRRRWVHGKAEATGFEDDSMDLFSLSFVIHECPQQATRDIIAEAARVLKPGGVFVMTDNNPQSSVIQNLPPALATLMKSTEPHSDEYYTLDVEQALRDAGFTDVHSEASDPRHRTVLGTRS